MLATSRKLLELVRFSHTIFALPFALLSAAMAWKHEPFRWADLIGVLACMVFARSFAMAFNRLVDRRIDAKNPRTAGRHLPAGLLTVTTVTLFTLANAVAFVAATLIFYFREPSNPWPLYLSAPVLVFLAGYSLTKRFTSLAHVWLGVSLSLAPVAAWIAVRGLVEMEVPLLLGGVVLFWVTGFDILYACQDATFDASEKLHSIPARFGVHRSLRIASACHAVMFVLLLALVAVSSDLQGPIFLAACGAVGVLLVYEHAIVSAENLSRVNRAFFQVNAVISLGLLAVGVAQLWVK
ncbi:UbiA-like polyprenyltransferase [Limnoglobus roseus]|uniref:4-hydroxybenzoate polyprenyltransferase n=1 Tax=Limnoglobus roseus TaxID=2598579 RepID=A0A5C1A643_9BACT|nr:UbiA-like polyprenyltransferase [Limnoglobus roseus]QEL13803.1 4-hydroxybenzoate octaprenyltransferase [Limnoglobus roseus]